MSWNPGAFSLASAQSRSRAHGGTHGGTHGGARGVVRATERRYDPSAPPFNDTANAGGSVTRAGRPAGFQPDDSKLMSALLARQEFDTMVGPITDDEIEGRVRNVNDIPRSDVRDVVMAREGAPVKRAEIQGGAPSPFLSDFGFGAAFSVRPEAVPSQLQTQMQPQMQSGSVEAAGRMRQAPTSVAAANVWQQGQEPQDLQGIKSTTRQGELSGLSGVVSSWQAQRQWDTQSQGQNQTQGQTQTKGALWPTTTHPTRLQALVPEHLVDIGAGTRGRAPVSDYDLRVAANGMATFDESDGALSGGDLAAAVPRRQDLGMAIAHPSQTVDWRALISNGEGPTVAQGGRSAVEPGHQSGRGAAGGAWARAAAFAQQDPHARWSDGKFGHGDGVDAQFVGVSVNPYSGVEYDEYENEAPAPTGDYRQKDSAVQRHFESIMGGFAPGRPVVRKTETINDWSEAVPDVDERDVVEYGRTRAIEYARRSAFWAPHTDEAAWTDAEGYKSVPGTGIPVNRVGFTEAVRFPAMPALHLHAGMSANPMTGGGLQPGEDGTGVPNGPSAPPSIAVRLKKAPVVSVHGAVGQGAGAEGVTTPADDPLTHTLSERNDLLLALGSAFFALTAASSANGDGASAPPEAFPPALRTSATDPLLLGAAMVDAGLTGPSGAGLGDFSAHKRTSRADERARAVGDVGLALITRINDGVALPPELSDAKPQERDLLTLALGRAILHLTDGLSAAGGGASNVAPGTWADAQSMDRVAPGRSHTAWAAATSAYLANVVAAVDAGTGPSGDPLSRALSQRDHLLRALGSAFLAVTSVSSGSAAPPAEFPEALKAAAKNPLLLGAAMVDMGLVGASGAGLGDFSEHKRTARADMRAMGVGDVGMALVTRQDGGGAPLVPPELHDLKPQERDVLTLALGRALLRLTDGALHAAGGGGPALPASFEKARRQPAFVEALGRLAIQLAGDAVGPLTAPGNWADAQSGDRVAPLRSQTAWARDVGSRLAAVFIEAEGLGTAGLADASALKKRKLAAYTQAIARKLENINVGLAQGEAAGTGGLTQFTRTNRARKDAPNLRGSAPFKIIDGADGLGVATEEFQRWAARAGLNVAVAGNINAEQAQATPPTREREWTRHGLRFGGNSVSTRTDNFASGGDASGGGAGAADYTEIDTKYFEQE